MKTVFIADSHPVVQVGITQMLSIETGFKVIGTARTSSELFEKLENETPDILMLEMDFPEINGIACLRKMKKNHPDVKVLMYSGQSEDVYAISSIRAGAQGYLSKNADLDYIVAALEKISDGKMFITNELAQRLAFDEGTQKPRRLFRKLSTREIEVLKMLASGKRNKDVALGLGLNEKTISTYKARLMKKLNVDNMVDLLQQAKALDIF
ncbi:MULTISPECIES: response regulator [Cellulophaga]|uniref:Two component transcriptional regulator, LuxR family n=2 Tax=Cellulophaga TaxID=104264 RepID=F0RDR5_CELLC|nr:MULTISPECIES: response regulator transcription factor [Cellulophaga]ADY29826.1 two component transcriptional regulator, LuxR family [Cellulophaga lytica DSM 7489]AIM60825.1 ligand-binding protein SH3 [Cellulophaga lytica]APU10696.1 DNA-binding response regulator [Cellulophaga lytica]EWH15126.1 LuxR family two component transcriptional regulator [Cellulophaga geojensis KL-A]MDO6490414.1 response regulator transcription factor [Cellulophaga sp. 2_MG-2023]|eukprot:TRINITY_DN117_c0_g1_i1.p1 TRINITY_DN117_c0_g1~~TRINITY_DN117_c0_g1_i1.p1  ORF type:complete len:210 (-),score=22.48 TRINITY_DN117_c0_g1_i1:29-658(-)